MRRAFAWVLGTSAVMAIIAACSSDSSSGDAFDASAPNDGSSDAAAPSDAASDANADGGASIYGDRNLGVDEPYPDYLLIQNGGRFYNVQKPPLPSEHVAKADGVTDDTVAITDAFDYLKAQQLAANPTGSATEGYDGSNSWIYLPNGTYLVSSTLIYTGENFGTMTGGDDILRVRIVGENREKTTIRLHDDATGFGDVTKPQIVLELQHDGTPFNNGVSNNVVDNLTIDTGKGNPGAVGLWFQGANLTGMHNVLIRSEDGAGHCGLLFQTGSVQGDYRDITVQGFDYGICQTANAEVDSALEHITLSGQAVAGVLVQGGGMSLRSADIDESTTKAEGLRIEQTGAVVVVDQSELLGTSGVSAIDRTRTDEEALFLRDIVTSGFDHALLNADAGSVVGPNIDAFGSSPPVVLADSGAPAASLGLPVLDTPLSDWFDPATQWANVDDYETDGAADDTAAVTAAMKSGKPVVVFPKTAYTWTGSIDIPATVMRVDFLFADIHGGLSVSEASTSPLRLSYHANDSGFTLAAQRDVVLEDFAGSFSNAQSMPVNVFLENIVNIGQSNTFDVAGQTTYARSLDNEEVSGRDIYVNGGTLWMFGYKTENKPTTSVYAAGGAQVEVLGGYVNMTEDAGDTPMIVNSSSTMSFIGFTNLGAAIHGPFRNILLQSNDAGSEALSYAAGFGVSLPKRGGTYAADFVIPLYYGAPH